MTATRAQNVALERTPPLLALPKVTRLPMGVGAPWALTNRADPAVARMADDHYSRKAKGSRQFHPPGQSVVLYVPGPEWPFRAAASWVWWRPMPWKAHRYDPYDGWWNCSLFCNEGAGLSSVLITAAIPWALAAWGLPTHGFDTYVWPEKVRSPNPGFCYKVAGWQTGGWSKDGKKRRLFLPKERLWEVLNPVTVTLALHWAWKHKAGDTPFGGLRDCTEAPCPEAFRAVVSWLALQPATLRPAAGAQELGSER